MSNETPTSTSDEEKAEKLWQHWAAVFTVAAGLIGVLAFFGITNFDQLKHPFDPTAVPTQSASAGSSPNGLAPIIGSSAPASIPSGASSAPAPSTPEIIPPQSPQGSPVFTAPDGMYDAQVGDCVYGAAGPGQWNIVTCAKGNFTVLAMYTGTANTSVCSSGWGTLGRYYKFNDSEHDKVVCLRYNYYSVIGYATVSECFAATGPSNDLTFSYTSSCAPGDVVVVAHYSADDPSRCTSNGSDAGDPPGFPNLAWTVCFNDIN